MPTSTRECDVCVLVDKDHEPKAEVGYCSMCNAFMCPACRDDGPRRAKAWGIRTIQRMKAGLGMKVDGEGVKDGRMEDGRR
jgi:hypothetical protein